MAKAYVLGKASVTLTSIVQIIAVDRFYCISDSWPEAPTEVTPPSNWTTSEPQKPESTKNKALYSVIRTTFEDGSVRYSDVRVENSYEQLNEIEVGERNLIRNSFNMLFEDYYFFTERLVVTDDGAGNLLWVSPTVKVIDDGNGNITIDHASLITIDDGEGNITLKLRSSK